MLEVTLPLCRVLVGSIAAMRGPIENAFDPSAQPRRGLSLGRPHRSQNLKQVIIVDGADIESADHRVRVAIQLAEIVSAAVPSALHAGLHLLRTN